MWAAWAHLYAVLSEKKLHQHHHISQSLATTLDIIIATEVVAVIAVVASEVTV